MSHLLIRANSLRIPLADSSVQCVITSPPYYGLRDYGTVQWQGGNPDCEHKRDSFAPQEHIGSNGKKGRNNTNWDHRNEAHYRDQCGKCGAKRIDNQLGLEPTPDEFVANMVAVFREVRRVLRDDGVCFMNLGDSYNGYYANQYATGLSARNQHARQVVESGAGLRCGGLKPKDLVGIPWRVALALQADGWYLRSDIIWAKPNPMPESVTDRPTKSHEYVFLLTKSASYYWDAEAVRECGAEPAGKRRQSFVSGRAEAMNRKPSGNEIDGWYQESGNRNIRTVWQIPTESYPGAHFATFPRKLVEPCVKAGTSQKGCCPECGKGWVREVESPSSANLHKPRRNGAYTELSGKNEHGAVATWSGQEFNRWRAENPTKTTGWRAQCTHGHAPVPCLVFDPFTGSGTTGVVAEGLHRNFVGIDLSREYLGMARNRIERPHKPIPRPGRVENHPLFDR